ncbi:FAD-dependent oxidoreductase [Ammoniphilus sp. 3BR4]|uniref:FAD-dependent oxidoreductase n=1 Tax=Ammoniphilus sp. 3BR4 TaxID=3158265 RepID=UPI0034669A75
MNLIEHYDVVIVGGGLAGLAAAAHLSHKGKKVILLERGVLGGRAVTLNLKGFSFNFGAHAIYGRDASILCQFEKELGLRIDWRDFNPIKAKYDIGAELTDVPANIQGLFRTKVLKGTEKIKFTFEILKTITKLETGHPHVSIQKWMEQAGIADEVKEMMLTLASSNFFTKEPEKIPSDVFFAYYQKLFQSQKPVTYIGGGWQALIDEFVRVILENDGRILTKSKVESVTIEENRVRSVHMGDQAILGDEFVFCIPPKELVKISQETGASHLFKYYSNFNPATVFVYDIGLKTRLDMPYTYIYDKRNNIFITDISYYDESCIPEGGQLLQAIAYLKPSDLGNKEVLDLCKQKIEELYDKHFSGWREALVVPRISQRATAQEIKWTMDQKAMPTSIPDFENLFFAGDWCEGEGQLSELSFSSAYEVGNRILQKKRKKLFALLS